MTGKGEPMRTKLWVPWLLVSLAATGVAHADGHGKHDRDDDDDKSLVYAMCARDAR